MYYLVSNDEWIHKYFENGGKGGGGNMFFRIKDDRVLGKYNEIWNKIKRTLNTKFNGVIKTNFWGYEIPKEGAHHTCIACITIDSVMEMDKKNYPQVYLEEYKYEIKKIKTPEFID